MCHVVSRFFLGNLSILPVILQTDFFLRLFDGLMRAAGRNTCTSIGVDPSSGRRSEQVSIQGIKQWAKANLPATSHLCRLLLLEEDLLTVDEFLAKMDVWLKLLLLEEQTL